MTDITVMLYYFLIYFLLKTFCLFANSIVSLFNYKMQDSSLYIFNLNDFLNRIMNASAKPKLYKINRINSDDSSTHEMEEEFFSTVRSRCFFNRWLTCYYIVTHIKLF